MISCDRCGGTLGTHAVWSLGKPWHPACLRCFKCDQPLQVNLHGLEDGLPTCGRRNCHTLYESLYYCDPNRTVNRQRAREPCHRCCRPVLGPDSVNSQGRTFHQCCFRCIRCGRLLSPPHFEDHFDGPICIQPCEPPSGNMGSEFEIRRPVGCSIPCMGCWREVTNVQVCVRAHGGIWHQECFRCQRCGRALTAEASGVLFHRRPFCGNCHPNHAFPDDSYAGFPCPSEHKSKSYNREMKMAYYPGRISSPQGPGPSAVSREAGSVDPKSEGEAVSASEVSSASADE